MTSPTEEPRPPSRAKEIFQDVIELPRDRRGAELDKRTQGDPALRAAVQSLLDASDRAEGFLAGPTVADASVARAAESDTVPHQQIGPYKLLQVIGEGGFGTVHMAEQETPVRRRVALKVIKLGMDTKQVVARFEQERQALAIMDHPNIAKVFDAGATETGRPYFVMELVRGDPITRYCDANRLTPRERLELFVPVCQAVQHAHQKGVIHRDIKPSNVLVTLHDGKPVPKVIDFGVAKATQSRLTEKTVFTEFRQMIGTPEYMSPEQAEMSGLDIDTRSDIYSLGVLLYELLTGTTPFDARDLRSKAYAEIQRVIREVDPPKPSTRLESMRETIGTVAAHRNIEPRRLGTVVRGELDWIVMKCLEKDRTRRYETASSLAADVTNYLSGAAVSAASPSAGYRLRKFVRRNKVTLGVAASIFVALLTGLVLALWGLDRAKRAEQVARTEAAISGQINRFLTDMLKTADPNRAEKPNITVRDALEGATRALDAGALSNQPQVEAAVRATIGGVLQSLGQLDDSVNQLRRALDAQRARAAAGTGDDAELSRTLNLLGIALAERGEFDEAERLTRESLEIRKKRFGDASPEVGETLGNLGALRADQGDHAGAETLYRQAFDVHERLPLSAFGEDQKTATMTRANHRVSSMNNLARSLRALGKLEEAERLYRTAIDESRGAMGPDNALGVMPMNNLARLLNDQRRYAEAEQIERESLRIARAALPAGHLDVLLATTNLGTALLGQAKYEEAEPLYRELLDAARKPGVPPMLLTDVLLGYWTILAERGRLDDAEVIARELMNLTQAQSESSARLTALAQTRLAYVYAKRGQKLIEAETLLRTALSPPEKLALPETHWALQSYRGLLGYVLLQLGKTDEAAPLITKAHEIIAADATAIPRAKRDARDWLAQLYDMQGRPDEAAKLRAAATTASEVQKNVLATDVHR
jgi:serine/threonine protein kinase/tetratricopeptide (TPR) repeat protein